MSTAPRRRQGISGHSYQLVTYVTIFTHSLFSSLTFENDLGLLELASKILFDKFKSPVALVHPETDLGGKQVNRTTTESDLPHPFPRNFRLTFLRKITRNLL
jgi:hypothetical protein